MPIFRRESLENLRQKIDLIEVLSPHLELKPAGATYKALCPFHDEKTPSFVVQRGSSHYHCFGCGAHGDAIHFLMSYLKMNFLEAIEHLAARFQVFLEPLEQSEKKGPNKIKLKEALQEAIRFFHYMLLHTEEGHQALNYLYRRGITLNFIQQFHIGLAPSSQGLLHQFLKEKGFTDRQLLDAGLLKPGQNGHYREFFSDRITFPIHQANGSPIGFSARKYREATFGGKYVNTPETALFKKGRTLFGLNYCRKQIAKERIALIVEGQIDALSLIYHGFNLTVAAQGTAFGEGHVKELTALGVNQIYLAFDADQAGQEAASKVGHLFQKEGVAVSIAKLPYGSDPDSFIREEGPEAFQRLLDESEDYLPFLVNFHQQTLNTDTPAGKNELLNRLSRQIRLWDHPLMVHESLRQLAHLTQVPEQMLGVGQTHLQNIHIRKSDSIGHQEIDPDRVLEGDLLRWLLLKGASHSHFIELCNQHLTTKHFRNPLCRKLYHTYVEQVSSHDSNDLLSIAISLNDDEGQKLMSELMEKKVNPGRAEEHFRETLQRLLDRDWMQKREMINMKIQSGQCSDDEVTQLMKEFDTLKNNPPKVS